jgi:LAO/AO transport system kinase
MLMELEPLVEGVIKGDQRALARAISLIEEGGQGAHFLSTRLYSYSGKALSVGIVGPMGSGKSTIIDGLIAEFRAKGYKVGVLTVDPSSPLSGGSLLGDRIRMLRHTLDSGVYVRSLAARGKLGGLARRTSLILRLLEAAGLTALIVESIGAGQADVEISHVTDVTVVVLMPGLGDEIQSFKAGLMESGDIFVLNKADMERAELYFAYLREALLGRPGVKIVKTIASRGEGIPELFKEIIELWRMLKASGDLEKRRRERLKNEIVDYLLDFLRDDVQRLTKEANFQELLNQVYNAEIDPLTAAKQLYQRLSIKGGAC